MLKSSAYPPLDGLVDLACRDGVDIRPTLLRVLTDLYVQKPSHSSDEEAQYVELALGLIHAVDAPTRNAVAARLSAYRGAPAAVLTQLGITALTPAAGAAAQNEGEQTVSQELIESFFAAGTEERRLILHNLAATTGAPARRPAPPSDDTIRRLENAALQHNLGEFSHMLERALGVNRDLADRITQDQSGESIVVAAKGIGMTAAVLQRILLFLNPAVGQSVERVYGLARLYGELSPSAAECMLEIWRTYGGRSRTVHAPVVWDDERRDARKLSTPARYRTDRSRVEQPTRTRTNGA